MYWTQVCTECFTCIPCAVSLGHPGGIDSFVYSLKLRTQRLQGVKKLAQDRSGLSVGERVYMHTVWLWSLPSWPLCHIALTVRVTRPFIISRTGLQKLLNICPFLIYFRPVLWISEVYRSSSSVYPEMTSPSSVSFHAPFTPLHAVILRFSDGHWISGESIPFLYFPCLIGLAGCVSSTSNLLLCFRLV